MRLLSFTMAGLLAVILLIVFWFAAGYITYIFWYDNPTYARRFSEDRLPFEAVLESRRLYNSFDRDTTSCTFAIVRLPAGAPTLPPAYDPTSKGAPSFGPPIGYWRETPAEATTEHLRVFGQCSPDWHESTAKLIQAALDDPGSFFVPGRWDRDAYLYSAPHRVAALINFGD